MPNSRIAQFRSQMNSLRRKDIGRKSTEGAAPPLHTQDAMHLLKTVEDLAYARDLAGVMEVVRKAARELAEADGATFVLREGDRVFYADEDAIAPLWKGLRFPVEACISGWSMNHREQVRIEDIYADPRIPTKAYAPTFVKSLVMTPVRREDPIAAIGAYWAKRKVASPREATLLQMLADSAALALERAQLHESERRATERLRVLTEASRAFSAAGLELNEVLRVVCAEVATRVGDSCTINLFDESAGVLEVVATHHVRPEVNDSIRQTMTSTPVRRGDGLLGKVMETGAPVFLPVVPLEKLLASSKPEYRAHLEKYPIGSIMVFPLRVVDRIIGTLSASRDAGHASFTSEDQSLLQKLADRAALTINSAREHAELEKQRQFLQVVLQQMPSAVAIAEAPSGKRILSNGQNATIFRQKHPASEGLNQYAKYKGLHPNGREMQAHEWPMSRSILQGEVVQGEQIHIFRGDGTEGYIRVNSAPIKDEQGRIVAGVVTYDDVTEQIRTEQALKASERHFRFLADNLPQILWTANPDGYVDYFNERWYEFTGFERGKGGDDSWKPILHPEDKEKCLDSWYQSVQTGQLFQIEYRFKDRKTENYRWFLGRAVPFRDEQGRITKWFGTCTDIQDQKESSERLGQALQIREDFLAIAGHELKTPLAALLLHIQSIQRAAKANVTPAKLNERLEKASNAGLRLESLVNQMLDVSRITAGRLRFELEVFALNNLIQEVVERFSEAAVRAGSPISLQLQSEVVGSWDRLRIDQVLTNLVANALKYGRGKPIAVSLMAKGGEAVFQVRDQGIGIEPSEQDRIFNRFERAVGARQFGGFGLGLWISRQIVEGSGGRIEVTSKPGQGATFTVRLPIGLEESPA